MKSLRSEELPGWREVGYLGRMRNPWEGRSRYESDELGSGDRPAREENKVGKALLPIFSSVTTTQYSKHLI